MTYIVIMIKLLKFMTLLALLSCGQNKDELRIVEVNQFTETLEKRDITRNESIDRMFYAVNSKDINSPMWINTQSDKDSYGSEYMKLLIQEAHKVASTYLEYGDNFAYSNFMMLALTFPLHEGLYMSFRQVFDGRSFDCHNDSLLEKMKIKNDSSVDKQGLVSISSYDNFIKYLRNTKNSFIPNCKVFSNKETISQYVHGADGTDIGPVQLSIRWHYKEFLAKEMYLNLSQTFNYGLKYMYEGHRKIYYDSLAQIDKINKKEKMTSNFYANCLINIGDTSTINSQKLIRGAWAGKYNQGQTSKTCRIQEVQKQIDQGTYVNHKDYHFYSALKKVESFKNKEFIGYSKALSFKTNDKVKSAINQIINNYQNIESFDDDKIKSILND